MKIREFQALLKPVTDLVSNMAIDAKLAEELNRRFPPQGDTFATIEKACHQSIADGWMCANGEVGRRWGRVIEPCEETGLEKFSGLTPSPSQRRGLHGYADHAGSPI